MKELKHEAADLHRSMEAERLALRDEKKRHQIALDDIRSRARARCGGDVDGSRRASLSLADAEQAG